VEHPPLKTCTFISGKTDLEIDCLSWLYTHQITSLKVREKNKLWEMGVNFTVKLFAVDRPPLLFSVGLLSKRHSRESLNPCHTPGLLCNQQQRASRPPGGEQSGDASDSVLYYYLFEYRSIVYSSFLPSKKKLLHIHPLFLVRVLLATLTGGRPGTLPDKNLSKSLENSDKNKG